MNKTLLNLVLFQCGWFVCIWGVNTYAIAYTAVALLIHHFFVAQRGREWILVIIVALTGVLWDAFVASSGWMSYSKPDVLGIPIWLICLWALFATTLQHSLVWLQRRTLLAALFGLIFGPFSYWAGTHWGGAQLGQPTTISLLAIGLGWFVLLPSYTKIAQRLQA